VKEFERFLDQAENLKIWGKNGTNKKRKT
jgi:hypothetical protein